VASLIGTEIGKYRITERLGQGGMAEVYAGIHTHLDRKVAVKVLHSYLLEGGDFVARFKREAKAVANLRHPNIVQVYDFDIQDDLIFMVMEYIDGVNLHTKLVEVGNRGERMPIKLIGSIINDIASALDYAHTKDMLHRDIKPSNIMLDKDDKAYLTDFGIAKLLSDQKFTATGTLVGTPAYMSPEQGLGDDVSKESDIYSLGVVAFEMLTGQVPYDAKTPIGIVHKQINDPIPNMSELVDGMPSTAQEVIDQALAKAPESRFSSAEDLVGALRTALKALESTDPIAVPAEESPTVVDDVLEAPTVTMKAEEMEQATVVMESEAKKEEAPDKKPKKKEPKQIKAPKPQGEKKKIPLWAYIAGGVALLAVVGTILFTQVFDLGLGGASGDIPSVTITASVHAAEGADGLSLVVKEDGDFEYVTVRNYAGWQTGSGQAVPADNNDVPDSYLYFQIDDDLLHQLPEGSSAYVDVELLNSGNDTLVIEYDSHSGGEFSRTKAIEKTDSGEFITVRFILSDVFFGNRSNGADFRITDNVDGKEIIRSVELVYTPGENAEQAQEESNSLDPDSGTDPDSPSEEGEGVDLFNAGEELFHSDQFEEALGAFDEALAAGYESADLYITRGRAKRHLGHIEESIEDFNLAIGLDENQGWAWYNRGESWFHLGDYYAAIDDYLIAIDKGIDEGFLYFNLGETYYLTGEDQFIDEAHFFLDQAIEMNPEEMSAYRVRGDLKAWRFNNPEGALEDLNIAVELSEPGVPDAFISRGAVYKNLGEYQLCVEDNNIAYGMTQDNLWLFLNRGDCLAELGYVGLARIDYERLLDMAGDNPEFAWFTDRIHEWLQEH